ncbi:MAG TPA: methyltransferase, partial [Candidatus Polarisedimenticolaceae bacterium]|nr:methyltransferase [Candidatus Polarisedimenticolaceae bacterium]
MLEPPRPRRWLARVRVGSVFGLLALLVVCARPTPLSVTLGFAVCMTGEFIRIWAAGHLHKTVELVTSGPYRFTRNPLYLGRLLIFSGICVMSELPNRLHLVLLALGWVVFFAYYLPRKERVERGRLRQLHGARFERYEQAVPALFPSPRPHLDRAS